MTLGQTLAAELKHEAATTRKMLERVPEDKFDWQPHEKSMKLGRLATHVAEISHWVNATLTQDEMDFATSDYKPSTANTAQALVEILDKTVGEATELLENVSDEDIKKKWRLRSGEKIFFELPKIAVIRSLVLNHLIHHRGQLSVYLRLNDVPLPGVYGPTADEPIF